MTLADFVPKRRVITAITNAQIPVVTSASHGYSSGEYVRINVPVSYGMRLEHIVEVIEVIDADSFSITTSTLLMDPFVVPGAPLIRAEAVPVSGPIDNVA